MNAPRIWYALVLLEDLGDSGPVGGDSHRYHTAHEMRDVIESMEPPRGVQLRRYALISESDEVVTKRAP